MNVPIYRAKKIDSDEYVIGTYMQIRNIELGEHEDLIVKDCTLHKWDGFEFENVEEIDPTTLSISFDDMLDSEGNRIFASLSDDGRGGDNVEYKLNDWKKAISVCRYKDKQIVYAQKEVKVIGIHE